MDAKKLNTGSRDYISCLPDEVLGKILSSIPTKQAASTSVLSQKWRNVFRLVHNLDFDGSLLLRAPEEGEEKSDEIQERFRSFVNRTLASQCGSPVKRFSLNYRLLEDCEMVHVCRWICDVVERGVLELDIRINAPSAKQFLPSQLFTSKTLVKLTLRTRLFLGKLPSDAFLPSLNTLFVEDVFFEYKDACDVLVACCPVLEELSVRYEGESHSGTISSPTVKRLSVDYFNSWVGDERSLSLVLPNLVYLDYSSIPLKYPQVDLDSLVEVKLDLCTFLEDYMPDLTNLLAGIRKVEILHLSRFSVDVISLCVKHGLLLPVFINLVNLSFGSYNKGGWELLKYMIRQSPKLENLTIQELYGYTGDVSMPLEKVKVLHVRGYRGTAKELEQLKSFLRRIECLEVLHVDVTEAMVGDELKRDIMMHLGLSFPSKCKIKVTSLMAHVALLT